MEIDKDSIVYRIVRDMDRVSNDCDHILVDVTTLISYANGIRNYICTKCDVEIDL